MTNIERAMTIFGHNVLNNNMAYLRTQTVLIYTRLERKAIRLWKTMETRLLR